MTTSQVLHSQASSVPAGVAAPELCTIPQGVARSLHPRAPMQLRVVSGLAWVTLSDGPHGWREDSGDLMLHTGQSVCVASGQHAVVEPMGREPLQFQWRSAAAVRAPSTQHASPRGDVCRA